MTAKNGGRQDAPMESGKTRLPTDESEQNRRKRSKAVALKGDGTLDTPPIVSAVGFGKNAEQILDIAFANELKVRRDADLAEILAAMEVDSPVPLEALEAVAEILTYVYGLNRKMADHDKSVESAETWKP